MGSNSGRKYGSSGRSGPRKRVVIGADETVRVRYTQNEPQVEAERRPTARQSQQPAKRQTGQTSKQAKRVSAAKKLEREKRQRTVKVRRTAFLAGTALSLLLLIWACSALYSAPVFPVRSVLVTGASHLDKQTVIRLAALPSNATLLNLSGGRVERRLESNPWVANAVVKKSLPGTVKLKVTERKPLAVVDAGGTNLWVVSEDGYWLGRQTADDEGMTVIRDAENVGPASGERTKSRELLNALKVLSGVSDELRKDVRVVSAPTIDKTALITTKDVEVFVGQAVDLDAKDRIIRQILRSKKGEVVYINVRVVDSPIWRGLD